jgi:hypothetical protein
MDKKINIDALYIKRNPDCAVTELSKHCVRIFKIGDDHDVHIFPMWGGFGVKLSQDVFLRDYRELRATEYAFMNQWRQAIFHIDGHDTAFPGIWKSERHCGGWAVPYFTIETMQAVWEASQANFGDDGLDPFKWDSEKGVYYYHDDEDDRIDLIPIAYNGELYWNDGSGWIWDTVTLEKCKQRDLKIFDEHNSTESTLDMLCVELEEFCKTNFLESQSADEMVLELQDHIEFLIAYHHKHWKINPDTTALSVLQVINKLQCNVVWLKEFIHRWESAESQQCSFYSRYWPFIQSALL